MFAVAPTDQAWLEYQRTNNFNDQINFWTPSDWAIKALHPGDIIIFKLKGAGDLCGGYGTFLEYKYQSLNDTWDEFGRRNGFDNKEAFLYGLGAYQLSNKSPKTHCGCIVLRDVIYFDTPVKLSDYGIVFKPQVVKFATYVEPFPMGSSSDQGKFTLVSPGNKKKSKQQTTLREGQSQFHTEISIAYHHRCCISGETTPELLQAAHIQDYINRESNHIQNGLLLRIDLHSLFDNGLLYIDENYIVHISPLISSDDYKKFDNKKIALPDNQYSWPSLEALAYKTKSFRK